MPAAQHHPHRPPHARPGAHPTVGQISAFIQALFPVRTGDVHFAYHSPRIRHGSSKTLTYLNPLHNRAPASRVVLSITPTSGFYTAINNNTSGAETGKDEQHAQDNIGRRRGGPPQTPLAFLHRPWALDRRSVPRRATVIANHKGFDEVLTTGNNVALGRRLEVDVDNRAVVIQGYKGDPDRTIALIGLVGGGDGDSEGVGVSRENILQALEKEFGPPEGVFGFGDADTPLPLPTAAIATKKSKKKKSKPGTEDAAPSAADAPVEETVADTDTAGQEDTPIRVIAIMNAFHETEVEQVEAIARSLTSSSTPPPPRIFIPDIAAAVREVTETPPEPSQEDATEEEEEPIPPPSLPPPVIEKSSSSHVLYLTGAVREPGLLAARKRGMAVVCVGHRVCEEWGIRHIARLLREEWPGLIVDEVFEDESEVPEAAKREDASAGQREGPAGAERELVVVDDEVRSGMQG